MKIITDDEYQLFLDLKEKAEGIYSFRSAKDVEYLEDDIDAPIKNCVALLALFGAEPVFSCCGFNYEGQPIHKSHQYGNPYVKMHINDKSKRLYNHFQKENGLWKVNDFNKSYFDLYCNFNNNHANPHWRDKNCIHFSEECNLAINKLENFMNVQLYNFNEYFLDEVTIFDTNEKAKNGSPFWQYPPKKPWTIYKSDYIKE